MFWVVSLLLWAGTVAINRLFLPKRLREKNADPEAFQGITAEAGRAIPILWGTRQIKNSNISWFGDLSQTAIVQGGVTTGYKYYMGGQYLICLGEIDQVIDLRWNEKPVGTGLTDANNKLVIGIAPPPYFTATIPPGNYGDGEVLALAVENAMKAAQAGNWKATFGFRIRSGRNNRIAWGITWDGGTFKRAALVPAGDYNGITLAAALQTAMQSVEDIAPRLAFTAGVFTVTFDVPTNKFTISYQVGDFNGSVYNDWRLLGADDATFSYATNINSTIGYRMDISQIKVNVSGPPYPALALTPDFSVIQNRFIIAFGGTTGKLKLTDAGFTAAAILGLSTAADVDLLSKAGDSDFTVIQATYTPTTDYLQVDIDDSNFFGTEGGVQGRLDIYYGKPTQAESSYLTTKFGSTAPAFRRVSYAVQRGMYIGNTNYPKPISITPRRCPNQLGLTGQKQNIGGDANPAAMIWEALTDPFFGIGMNPAKLDKPTFLAVGASLFDEGLGLSLIVDAVGPGEDVIDEILRHVDAVRREDPITGLLGIRLIRNDYDIATIPLISQDNAFRCRLNRPSWGDTKNVVRVKFVDRDADYNERTFELQDAANIQARGGEMAIEEFSFPGISNKTVAAIVAARLLKAVSHPAAAIEIEANREVWNLRPGDPFSLTWADLGVTNMPCRVTRVRTGRLDDGRIAIDAVEDLSGPAWTSFAAISAPALDPPDPSDIPDVVASPGDTVLVGAAPMPGS